MTKTQIKNELMGYNANRIFISLTEIRKALGIGKDAARTLVTGLEYIPNGKRRDFLVDDVAKRLADAAVLMTGDTERKIGNLEEFTSRIS